MSRKQYDKKYYEKKKETKTKKEETNPYFLDFKLKTDAKELVTKIMSDHKSDPDWIHSFCEYFEVEYYKFYDKELKKKGLKPLPKIS